MRKLFILLFLFRMSIIVSQTTTLEPGVYKSNVKGQKIMLNVLDDNKYEMAFLFGKFSIENDTVHFKGNGTKESNFKIKANKEASFSSTLKIKFKTSYMMYLGRNIFIGTQKEDNSMVEYKPLTDYLKNKSMVYPTRSKEVTINIDKSKYLYFVENIQKESLISKFQIDSETNEIEVEYEALSLSNIQLKGVLDPNTKALSIMEGTKSEVLFTFEKEDATETKTDGIKPLQVQSDKNWLENNGFAQEEDTAYFGDRATATYAFKHTNSKNLEDALKNIAKSDSKFLAITFDNSKESKKNFAQFIKNSEQETSNYMRNGYNSEDDKMNFYLASEKDKTLLEKFKIKEYPTILFLNSNGELLYHTKGTLADNSDMFSIYYSVNNEIQLANAKLKLDKILTNKKSTLVEVKKGFLEISKAKVNPFMSNNDTEAVDSTSVEVEENYNEAVVDTTAAMAVDAIEDNYYHIKDRENIYSFKSSKIVVDEKWKAIVNFYTKENTFDSDFIEICKRELLERGFNSKLYQEKRVDFESDFKILDYLYKNYGQITKEETKTNPSTEEDENNPVFIRKEQETEISTVLSSFFSQKLSSPTNLDNEILKKYTTYYKTFLKISGYNLTDFKNYLEKIAENNPEDKSLYFSEFEDFFQTITSNNANLIESLDTMHAAQKTNFMDWVAFKETYSGLANTVAWDVVESTIKEPTTIQKAVKWSESSIKINPKSPYYLDTLGQLYYLNNEKEKAILTEQKAIDNIIDGDKERIKTYTDVLEKMKNGTY